LSAKPPCAEAEAHQKPEEWAVLPRNGVLKGRLAGFMPATSLKLAMGAGRLGKEKPVQPPLAALPSMVLYMLVA